ncbi:MAG: EAL domain-containing protein [Acidiphilium sp.]|nr:EAL domain-containing protein [Acidiphilium sp.]MDD4935802.1 EAL domain-containing protein [Acidiphilium sp.]
MANKKMANKKMANKKPGPNHRDPVDRLDVARQTIGTSTEALDELRGILRIARIGSWRVSVDNLCTTWSDEMHELVGCDPRSFVPSLDALIQLLAKADRIKFQTAFASVVEHRQGGNIESRGNDTIGADRLFWTDMQPEYDPIGKIVAVRGVCQEITERKSAFERIRHLACHDPLTGLANRAHLSEQLDHILADASRRRESVAVLCFDLDGFKLINDLYGHAAGDEVLREMAKRLSAHIRETDIVARTGGDEFVVVQVAAQQPEAAQRLAARLLGELMGTMVLAGQSEVALSTSIGIAFYPDDATTPDDLLARADHALYGVKNDGRNNFAIYDRSMEREYQERRKLEHDLRLALQRGEFSLVYQPMLCTRRGTFKGFEALLRWNSLVHGLVSPEIFIGIAESIGIMGPLGAWVLRTACAEATRWVNPLKVAVNVSPIQIQQGNLAEIIAETLASTGLAPDRLEIEVTESLLIRNPERALETLRQIKALGVRIAMDDFGTGYSSLATLRAFPFDKLKVDRSFVKDLGEGSESLAIINAILGLGRGLRLPVVVEGVETEVQAAILRRCGCDEMQGYLLGRPSPIDRFDMITDPDGLMKNLCRSDTAPPGRTMAARPA